jgi:spore maturation protein CgeB
VRALYVGTLTPGSTSRMRAEKLRSLTPDVEWKWIDTDSIIINSSRLWQSAAYRFQRGKAVRSLNAEVITQLGSQVFDLTWVDKAIFLFPPTVQRLRQASLNLIHYTPDTAFHAGRSRYFEKTLALYDLLVTTKSFDVREYLRLAGRDTVHLTTQGFDASVHSARNGQAARRKEAVFVGLAEPDRERCISVLLSRGIPVRLAGFGWDAVVRRYRSDSNLMFEGKAAFADDYASLLSQAWIGLGLLSKRFPEQHTTRTFEIPACGAVLATEKNEDTTRFFSPDEALFFDDFENLADRITELFSPGHEQELASIAERGRQRVIEDGRNYMTILAAVLADPRIEPVL